MQWAHTAGRNGKHTRRAMPCEFVSTWNPAEYFWEAYLWAYELWAEALRVELLCEQTALVNGRANETDGNYRMMWAKHTVTNKGKLNIKDSKAA